MIGMPHDSSHILPFCPDDHSLQAQALLAVMKEEVVTLAAEPVGFLRDDYREFTEHSLLYLSSTEGEVTFLRPGGPVHCTKPVGWPS